jgi:hypothetical protein
VAPGRGSRARRARSPSGRTARGSRHWIVLAVVVVALCVVAVVAVGRDRRPVDIAVLDPPAASLGELLSRADLVVVGRIVQVAPGRVLSDPGDPDRAVRTQLAQLEVDEVTRGSGAARLVLEEVAALADGTPATVAGLEASRVGDAGLYLLVHGDDGRVGLAGPQGRYLLVADDPDRLRAPPGGDPLARRLADLGPRRLRRAVLGAASR